MRVIFGRDLAKLALWGKVDAKFAGHAWPPNSQKD